MAIPNSKMTQNMVMMQAESPLDQAMLPPRPYGGDDDSNKSNDDFKF